VSETSNKAVGAGKGLLFISGAKLWFMVAGYIIQFGLPRALGSPARFGVWVVVLALISPFNNVVVTATIQAVSKFSSEAAGRASAVTRAALRMQSLLGGGAALLFLLFAPVIAGFLHDPGLTPHLRLASGVIFCYSLYAVFVGAANGARAFHKQAALDVTFSTMRAGLVVGTAWMTHSALTAIGGFVGAAATILAIAFFVVGLGPKPAEKFPVSTLARFFLGVAAYLLIVNLLMFVDGLLLKRLVTQAATAAGAADPISVANTQEGFYGAVQAIARIPYQLILAVTFIIFPLVSKSTFDKDSDRTRVYVMATMRYSFVVTAGLALALGARPEAVMRLFYKPEYAVGASALSALIAGYVCFSLFSIAGTIINSAGKTRPTFIIGAITLTAATVANWVVIKMMLEKGGDALLAAALATTGAMLFGALVSGLYLMRHFGAFLSPITVVRVALSAAVALAVARFWPATGFLGGKLGTLMSCAAIGLTYLMVAVASGELRPGEIKRLRRSA
jgi:O-antigen/teichoic acid export membrane protein